MKDSRGEGIDAVQAWVRAHRARSLREDDACAVHERRETGREAVQ